MPLPPGFAPLDFDAYHRDTLPGLLAQGRGSLAAEATTQAKSLAFRLADGRAFTYRAGDGGFDVLPGDASAETVVEIGLDEWRGLVHELEAAAGLVYANRVRALRGSLLDLMAWESALRALYTGRPVYRPERVVLRARDGTPLDPEATFAGDADRDEMAHFLRSAGYLFVRDVFAADEIDAMRAEARELRAEARKGDKLSWWGRNAAGEEVVSRVTRGNAKPRLRALESEPRLAAYADLADELLVYKKGEGEGVTVIYKSPAMGREGLSDLPWHRDCGMGGHAAMCPRLLVSVYLSEATPETGELVMLPGSHRATLNAHDTTVDPAAHAAHFAARPGDVSVHYGDTVHAAPPPTAPNRAEYRISAVIGFAPPGSRNHRGEGSYNDALHRRDDGQIEHLAEVVKRS
jgi:ectoine hydroxylase-related dioxygenase (phytanoyl-CoA dioxygenase family)